MGIFNNSVFSILATRCPYFIRATHGQNQFFEGALIIWKKMAGVFRRPQINQYILSGQLAGPYFIRAVRGQKQILEALLGSFYSGFYKLPFRKFHYSGSALP
jgi:hypothetical protein